MITLPILTTPHMHFPLGKLGECTLGTCEQKGYGNNTKLNCSQIPRNAWRECFKKLLLLQNACRYNICPRTASCLNGFSPKGYMCECKPGFTGSNCEGENNSLRGNCLDSCCCKAIDAVFHVFFFNARTTGDGCAAGCISRKNVDSIDRVRLQLDHRASRACNRIASSVTRLISRTKKHMVFGILYFLEMVFLGSLPSSMCAIDHQSLSVDILVVSTYRFGIRWRCGVRHCEGCHMDSTTKRLLTSPGKGFSL